MDCFTTGFVDRSNAGTSPVSGVYPPICGRRNLDIRPGFDRIAARSVSKTNGSGSEKVGFGTSVRPICWLPWRVPQRRLSTGSPADFAPDVHPRTIGSEPVKRRILVSLRSVHSGCTPVDDASQRKPEIPGRVGTHCTFPVRDDGRRQERTLEFGFGMLRGLRQALVVPVVIFY